MRCICRNCGKDYESEKARGDWRGYCTAKCQHAKAKGLGYIKRKVGRSEYQVLNDARAIGDVPTKEEKDKLGRELHDLESSLYGSPSRIKTIRRLLITTA